MLPHSARPWGVAPSARITADGQRIRVCTDHVGLQHVFWTETPEFVAISDSALVLARFRRASLDEQAIAHLALLGFLLDDETLFRDVTRFAAGVEAKAEQGRITIRNESIAPDPHVLTGTGAIRSAVSDLLDLAPDAVLELSGGLDSRLILAAIPRPERRGRPAMTIDSPGSPETPIARAIAAREGLDHEIVQEPSPVNDSPVDIERQVVASARARDLASNCLAAAVLDRIESSLPKGPRLAGVNGEFARGFYYPGTFPLTTVSNRGVRRLGRWRLFTNDRVDPTLFDADWLHQYEVKTLDSVRRSLLSYGQRRLRPATDEFYLDQRVARWAGPTYSHSSAHRIILAPFLHPAFLAWARHTPPREKAGSRALAAVLGQLDPALADFPQAGWIAPVDVAGTSLRSRARQHVATATKIAKKVGQRISNETRAAGGTSALLAALRSRWESDPSVLLSSEKLGYLDGARLVQLAERSAEVDVATASFLINVGTAVSSVGTRPGPE